MIFKSFTLIAVAAIGLLPCFCPQDSFDEPTVMVTGGGQPTISKDLLTNELAGSWRLDWDDRIDGELDAGVKSCNIDLDLAGRVISGRFNGPVLGAERKAIFTGEVFGEFAPLISLVQRETNYTCTYQIWWAPVDSAVPTGVWHDTNGASGDFSLLRYQ